MSDEKYNKDTDMSMFKNHGRVQDYTYQGERCVRGKCKNLPHYETYHDKDCPFYPKSFSEQYDKLLTTNIEKDKEIAKLVARIKELESRDGIIIVK